MSLGNSFNVMPHVPGAVADVVRKRDGKTHTCEARWRVPSGFAGQQSSLVRLDNSLPLRKTKDERSRSRTPYGDYTVWDTGVTAAIVQHQCTIAAIIEMKNTVTSNYLWCLLQRTDRSELLHVCHCRSHDHRSHKLTISSLLMCLGL